MAAPYTAPYLVFTLVMYNSSRCLHKFRIFSYVSIIGLLLLALFILLQQLLILIAIFI